jgi:hypothetical protein
MVTVIKTGHSIHRILNYNENKVKEGVAVFMGAGNYPIDDANLTINIKLNRMLKQTALNENVTRNSVHISLNFDPSEIALSKEKLMAIAHTYMEKIGFGQQPYLVYQHHDAGHPHIHIVSIKVREDGSRIDTQNIGQNQSEIARKEIEISFGLVPAERHKRKQDYELKIVAASKVLYGRTPTKRAITNVLDVVLNQYKYTSLPELNAVLQQYNIMADRGSENSRVFVNKGLLYRILDENGNKAGVPIKASDFYSKPTLKFIEEKFIQNEQWRKPHKLRVKNTIDLLLLSKKTVRLPQLIKRLEKEGIKAVLRQNADGLVFGITYVDHRTKCVFNGSALGKQYSAKAIQERCGAESASLNKTTFKIKNSREGQRQWDSQDSILKETSTVLPISDLGKVLDQLLQPEQASDYLPKQLKGKRKKKKRKGQSDNQ